MKQTLIPILLLILCSVNLIAQDTIVLDGKMTPKKELSNKGDPNFDYSFPV